MKTKNINEVKSFIRELDLAQPRRVEQRTRATLADNSGKAGYVDSGSLVSFVAGVSAQHQSDALNSTLLAQLAANKKYDREGDPVSWYKYYRNVLEVVGWVVPELTFTQFKGSTATFSADEVIIKLLESIATPDDLAVVTQTITAIQELSSSDEKVKLFNTSSTSLSKGNFQVGSVGESDGVLVMKMGIFYFSTDRSVTNLLFFKFENSKTSFFIGAQIMNLDEDVYSKVRQQVIDKLGENASTQIANLDI